MKCLACLCLLLVTTASAQQITYVQAQVTGDFVTVYYTLVEEAPGQSFAVALYGSQDGFGQPLSRVRGDVGDGVTAGGTRQIEWGIGEELPDYQGTLTFEVRARLTFAPVTIRRPQAFEQLQRGKSYRLAWEGGLTGGTVDLFLVTADDKAIPVIRVPNTGAYDWTVPRHLPRGRPYRLRIAGDGPRGEYYTDSGRFFIH
jgi:hypothetical protein